MFLIIDRWWWRGKTGKCSYLGSSAFRSRFFSLTNRDAIFSELAKRVRSVGRAIDFMKMSTEIRW